MRANIFYGDGLFLRDWLNQNKVIFEKNKRFKDSVSSGGISNWYNPLVRSENHDIYSRAPPIKNQFEIDSQLLISLEMQMKRILSLSHPAQMAKESWIRQFSYDFILYHIIYMGLSPCVRNKTKLWKVIEGNPHRRNQRLVRKIENHLGKENFHWLTGKNPILRFHDSIR